MKIDMSTEEILKELRKRMVPDIPKNAITRKMYIESFEDSTKRPSDTAARRFLDSLCDTDGWTKKKYKGTSYYWPLQE